MYRLKEMAFIVAMIILCFGLTNSAWSASYKDGYPVTFNEITIDYFTADPIEPTSVALTSYYTDVTQETGEQMGYRPGAVILETRGLYVHEAQAAAWYKVIDSNVGWPTLEYRYFAYDVTTHERTQTFKINYQHQPVDSHFGEIREWKYDTAMPIDYQLGPNEILGFYAVFHTHGAGGRYYTFEYYLDSNSTPSHCDVWYEEGANAARYYVRDHFPYGLNCYETGQQVTFNDITIDYFVGNTAEPTSDQLHIYLTDTTQETGEQMGYRPGGIIPETRGQYINQAQASAWYKVIDSNSGAPSIEFRYFAYDMVTGERTQTFKINYQHQWVSGHFDELREWKYGSTMPINYQLGPSEILGFYAVFHTHGASNIYYQYEYCIDSALTPTYCDIWFGEAGDPTRYYIQDFCTILAGLACTPSSGLLPLSTQFSVELINLEDGTRRIAGRLNIDLASGDFISNWKAGWMNVAAGDSFNTSWTQSIPALGTLIGENVFTLIAQDVTRAPYNQPPYQPAGDTFTDTQSVIGVSP